MTSHLNKSLVRRQQHILGQAKRAAAEQQGRGQIHGTHVRNPIGQHRIIERNVEPIKSIGANILVVILVAKLVQPLEIMAHAVAPIVPEVEPYFPDKHLEHKHHQFLGTPIRRKGSRCIKLVANTEEIKSPKYIASLHDTRTEL